MFIEDDSSATIKSEGCAEYKNYQNRYQKLTYQSHCYVQWQTSDKVNFVIE